MELPVLAIRDGEGYPRHCFGCGELNRIGLHLKPVYDGDKVNARFTPGLDHQGWHNVTHGGILYSVLDEVTAYAVLCSGYSFGVTARSTVRFKQVAPTDRTLIATAWATKVTPRLIEVRGVLELENGELIAETDSAFIPGSRADKAFIWDMDGVIVDSAAPHYESWRAAFSARGVTYTEEEFKSLFGTRDDFIINNVLGPLPHDEVEEIAGEKERRYRKLIKEHLDVFPGVMPLLNALKKAGFRVALGTSAPPENVEAVLTQLGLSEYFDATVSGQDAHEGKPSPDIYLQAAGKLGVNPPNCIVFEDSPHGVDAAKAAGMKCVAISNSHPAVALQRADRVVASLEEIDLIQLIRWI